MRNIFSFSQTCAKITCQMTLSLLSFNTQKGRVCLHDSAPLPIRDSSSHGVKDDSGPFLLCDEDVT